jgi:hypothetical protein
VDSSDLGDEGETKASPLAVGIGLVPTDKAIKELWLEVERDPLPVVPEMELGDWLSLEAELDGRILGCVMERILQEVFDQDAEEVCLDSGAKTGRSLEANATSRRIQAPDDLSEETWKIDFFLLDRHASIHSGQEKEGGDEPSHALRGTKNVRKKSLILLGGPPLAKSDFGGVLNTGDRVSKLMGSIRSETALAIQGGVECTKRIAQNGGELIEFVPVVATGDLRLFVGFHLLGKMAELSEGTDEAFTQKLAESEESQECKGAENEDRETHFA